jgi:hypothetical protein
VFILKNKSPEACSRPISIKHGTNHPWVKGFQNCTNKGPVPLQRGDNHKKCKNLVRSLKNFLLENHSARIRHTDFTWKLSDICRFKFVHVHHLKIYKCKFLWGNRKTFTSIIIVYQFYYIMALKAWHIAHVYPLPIFFSTLMTENIL